MEFEQLYAPSLKELFIQKLQSMILSGELPMGQKLPSERELCQQMGVSRAVVKAVGNGFCLNGRKDHVLTVGNDHGTGLSSVSSVDKSSAFLSLAYKTLYGGRFGAYY